MLPWMFHRRFRRNSFCAGVPGRAQYLEGATGRLGFWRTKKKLAGTACDRTKAGLPKGVGRLLHGSPLVLIACSKGFSASSNLLDPSEALCLIFLLHMHVHKNQFFTPMPWAAKSRVKGPRAGANVLLNTTQQKNQTSAFLRQPYEYLWVTRIGRPHQVHP